jgi:mannose-1-phosphate guanylyltransferase
MCGGIGSRFWPYSRTDRPKQFIDFFGTGRSLLQMSYDRVLPLVDKEHVIIVTNDRYAPLVREQLPELADHQILLEPARRNTAPCIAWAANHIYALDPEASMIVTPSDHLITREANFIASVENGFKFVEENNALLTLGIKPTRPETGYGYIQISSTNVGNGIIKVKTFTEKPDLEIAKMFLESGEFFWNSGIFIWSAKAILEALKMHAPDLTATFDGGKDAFGTPGEQAFIDSQFPSCPNISIDYAVMERASNVYVECVDFGWSDLGTWSSLYENSPKNREHNVTQNCRVLAYNSTGNIIAANSEKLVVVNGLKDFIVADADDVLLICPKSEEQHIKLYVNDVKLAYDDKYL